MNRRPDFFIIGAPRCGTTALSQYLRENPFVCFSTPKEPHYFATDFPNLRAVTTEGDYLQRCFHHATDRHEILGEGSAFYLFSDVAVPNILRFNDEARFIVLVRNPVDMAPSLHRETYYNLDESIVDFEVAWRQQESRIVGNIAFSTRMRDSKTLQYKAICSVGSQLERLFKLVDKDRVKVIVFDDFVEDTRRIYESVLEFLGLPADNRLHFPKINERKRYRSKLAHILSDRPPDYLVRAIRKLKRIIGVQNIDIGDAIRRKNTIPIAQQSLEPDFRLELIQSFAEEIAKLEVLLDRDFSHWRTIS